MKLYKLRHKPTGLYYKPSKHRSKSNLSAQGKVYHTRPSFGWLSGLYRPMTDAERAAADARPWGQKLPLDFDKVVQFKFIEDEWEIVELEVA